jgi:AcrR family transcriptional regulator
MARPAGRQGSETRERILDVALELFTSQGYDKTSLRDIAERLEITKAALYYYFARKEDILLELHRRMHQLGTGAIEELEAAPDGAARVAVWPRLADDVIDHLIDNRELILMHSRNRSALEGLDLHQDEERDVEERFQRVISSQEIPLRERVRMAAVIGVITEVLGESLAAFEDVPMDTLAPLVREAVADVLSGWDG